MLFTRVFSKVLFLNRTTLEYFSLIQMLALSEVRLVLLASVRAPSRDHLTSSSTAARVGRTRQGRAKRLSLILSLSLSAQINYTRSKLSCMSPGSIFVLAFLPMTSHNTHTPHTVNTRACHCFAIIRPAPAPSQTFAKRLHDYILFVCLY